MEELTCAELVATCKKVGVSETYSLKKQLVQRLHKYYEESFTATPDKAFFMFLRSKWKEVKTSDDKSKEEHFGECMNT